MSLIQVDVWRSANLTSRARRRDGVCCLDESVRPHRAVALDRLWPINAISAARDLGLVSEIPRSGVEFAARRRAAPSKVWNETTNERQRVIHSSGPKWWTAEGARHLRQFTDKLACFEHFARDPR